jgi:hypothetical protein
MNEATLFISSCCFNIKMFVRRYISGFVERFVAINGLRYSIEIAAFLSLSLWFDVIWHACERRQMLTEFWCENPKERERLEDPS